MNERTEKRFEKGETVQYVQGDFSVLLTSVVHCGDRETILQGKRPGHDILVDNIDGTLFALSDNEGLKAYLHVKRDDMVKKLAEIDQSLWAISVVEHNTDSGA